MFKKCICLHKKLLIIIIIIKIFLESNLSHFELWFSGRVIKMAPVIL